MANAVVDLAPREFDLLCILARKSGEVLPKHRLADALEPLGDPVDFNAIEVHVHKLRRKLGPQWIRTVRGVGYMLADNSPLASS
jgi:two-component system, OmpR family, response regulator QseB